MLVKVALDLPIYISVLGRDIMMIPLNPDERMLPDIEYLMPLFKTFVLNKFYIYLVLYGVIVAASHKPDTQRPIKPLATAVPGSPGKPPLLVAALAHASNATPNANQCSRTAW